MNTNATQIYVPESTIPESILKNIKNRDLLYQPIKIKKFGPLYDNKNNPIYEEVKEQKVLATNKITVDIYSDKEKKKKIRQEFFEVATDVQETLSKRQAIGEFDIINYKYYGIIDMDYSTDKLENDYTFPSGEKVTIKSMGSIGNGVLNCYIN
jgi:hypothetical protein